MNLEQVSVISRGNHSYMSYILTQISLKLTKKNQADFDTDFIDCRRQPCILGKGGKKSWILI